MQGDFMKMPFPDNSFDAVYAIEATCHAPDAVLKIRWPDKLITDNEIHLVKIIVHFYAVL